VKALRQVGLRRGIRFLWVSLLLSVLRRAWVPPVRTWLLRLYGARVGANVVVHRVTFMNADRAGFAALSIGDDCFIGDEVLLDLAAPLTLEPQVTLAARALVLTHLNVGYEDHPLQARFPSQTAATRIGRGSFVGAAATVLAGTTIGPEAFIAAGSLVNRDVAAAEVVGGVPIRTLRARD
jgi:acetyltransferase-like isoleucine patch superfamily enzyme